MDLSSFTFPRSVITFGLPPTRPSFRAFSRPALVRSDNRIRSCLAIVASMLSTASQNTPQESRYCYVGVEADLSN